KLRQEALEKTIDQDRLTGSLSRLRLGEAAQRALDWTQRTGGDAAFLAIGVDRMSMVNNAFGSDTGDAIPIGNAERLEKQLRGERIGWIGADRFGAVLINHGAEEVAEIARELLDAVRAEPFDTPSGALHATVSIGGALFPDSGLTAAEVVAQAESALHAAKREGRDRDVAHRPDP